jgi:hypothetical protein
MQRFLERLWTRLGDANEKIVQLERQLSELRSIVEYSVIRDARLIEFNHDFYFHYTADALGQDWNGISREAVHKAVEERRQRWTRAAVERPRLPDIEELLRHPPNAFTILTPLVLHLLWHHPEFQFIDIGANIGMTSFPIARLIKDFGRANKIFAFEPGPDTSPNCFPGTSR